MSGRMMAMPYPEPGLGAAWDYHDRAARADDRRAARMAKISARRAARRVARGAGFGVVPVIQAGTFGPSRGPVWTDSPLWAPPAHIVPGPGGAQLGALWDSHLEGLFGKLKKGLKKVAKVVKKVAPYAAAAAAIYFTAGAAAPMVGKIAGAFKPKPKPEVYGPPDPNAGPSAGGQFVQGLLDVGSAALMAKAAGPLPGSQAYYEQLPPGYLPPDYYSPYAGPGMTRDPYPYASYGAPGQYDPASGEMFSEAGMFGGLDMKTVAIAAGAAVVLLIAAKASRRR